MRNTIQKISQETLTLVNYLQEKQPGESLPYNQIEKETGVKMNIAGKGYLRSALNKLKMEKETNVGKGITIASEKSVTTIMIHRLGAIDNAVKRGERSYKHLSQSFFNKLNEDEKKQILFMGAAFGAIRVAAEMGKKSLKEATKISNYQKIEK